MKFEKRHATAIVIGIVILLIDLFFFIGTPWLIPLIAVAITFGWSQFWIDFFVNLQRQKNMEARFPDFVRYLVGAIRSGMPVSKAIIHVASTDFGDLSPYVRKLANQVEWSIPVHKALKTFAKDTDNAVIKRAIATVIEAEQAGGNIEDVLESVTQSVIDIKKIRERRRASIHSQTVQSYVIFIVFLIIMVVVQNLVTPYVSNITGSAVDQFGGEQESIIRPVSGGLNEKVSIDFSSASTFAKTLSEWFMSLRGVLLMIGLLQGLFTGMVIGKLAEGQIYPGLKHSLILMTMAFFVITLSQGI
ncbi:MAG TPA: type II secretion system F family protein [Candidatus Nanoarchaeia archaeon]|nr:type II secretion system F family protein [Candidatus Nanoarchaeia archaeon]